MKYSARFNYYLGLLLTTALLVGYLPLQSVQAGAKAPVAVNAAARTPVAATAGTLTKEQARQAQGLLPLYFEANRGQFNSQVDFVSRGVGYKTFLTPTEATFILQTVKPQRQESNLLPGEAAGARVNQALQSARESRSKQISAQTTVMRMKLAGSNPAPQVSGLEELPGKINYFRGNSPDSWVTNVPTFARVSYKEVYPGIDMVYYGKDRELEYDFVVAPGADPARIALSIEGAERVEVDQASGDLVMHLKGGGQLRQRKPLIFQQSQTSKQQVSGSFKISGKNISFNVGSYDKANTLIIDPVFTYSTFLGGQGDDEGYDIAADSAGNAYVAGYTASFDFPTANAVQPGNNNNSQEAFITKLNPSGSALIWSTYLGGGQGGDNDGAYGIAVDSGNNVYVTGYTNSANFPTKNALQPNLANTGNHQDGFVTKLNAAGNQLVFSTYLGGAHGRDEGRSIAVGADNSIYVAGVTQSFNFPTTNPLQFFGGAETYQASVPGPCACVTSDAFLTKLSPDGQSRVYSTFLGGDSDEYGLGLAVDSQGNAYITGWTDSTRYDPTGAPPPAVDSRISEFQIPTQNSGPYEITAGLDGNLWFTESLSSKVGRITPSGAPITEFFLSANSTPLGITSGSDGHRWATEPGIGRLARITSAGVVTEFPDPAPTPKPGDITAGPDGNLWFTELESPLIGQSTTGGAITHFPIPSGSPALGITSGPDGNLWFTVPEANMIGRITPAGVVTEFNISPDAVDRQPLNITAGPDGNLWFTEEAQSEIGRITPAGVVTFFPITSGGSGVDITTGPDGNLWFTETATSKIAQITPAGVVTEFQAPPGSGPLGITSGPDGNIWFTEFISNRIGRFALNPDTPAAPALPPAFPSPKPFPTTDGAVQQGPGGTGFGRDAFVTKVNAAGSALVYSTFLGGAGGDESYDIALGPDGSAYVAGYTESPNEPPSEEAAIAAVKGDPSAQLVSDQPEQVGFPVTENAYQLENNGITDAFLTRLSPNGSTLIYSTYLGGENREGQLFQENFGRRYDGPSVAVDFAGNAYITGWTESTFVAPGGGEPVEGAVCGNQNLEAPPEQCDDGNTESGDGCSSTCQIEVTNFPVKDAVQQTPGSDPGQRSRDAFVAKFNTSAVGPASLIYSTFLGGDNRDEGLGISVDSAGNAYITGFTVGATECIERPVDVNNPEAGTTCDRYDFENEFPTTPGAFQRNPSIAPSSEPVSNREAFVTKLSGGPGGGGDTGGAFSIVGQVTRPDGTPVEGVTITLTHPDTSTATTTTDANGNYSFDVIAGNYTVTPSGGSGANSFAPPSRNVTVTNQNERADFTATSLFSISGRVAEGANGISGVLMTLSGDASATTTTDSNGNYSFGNLAAGGDYTVTPSSPLFSFTPPSRAFNDLSANQTNADFAATRLTFSFSGRVTEGSAGLGGVTITVTRTSDSSTVATTTTANDGTYTVTGIPAGGDYTVTPSLIFYTFSPPNRTVTNVTSNQTGLDFAATRQRFAIAGRIATAANDPVSGVTVTLSGDASGATTTDANGQYTFGNLEAGRNYTVTPTKPNFTFAPPSRTINNLSGNQTADFTATAGTVTFTAAAAPGGTESTRTEGDRSFHVTVNRTGDTSGEIVVEYATFDGPAPSATPPQPPAASERSDYITSIGRLRFAPGETTKTITIFIIDDVFVEGDEVLSLVLSNPTNGGALGATSALTLKIVDNDTVQPTSNPIDDPAFFVRQHYIDFLNREPESGGFSGWMYILNNCGVAVEQPCDRVEVSSAFFRSEEFQTRSFFAYRFYSTAFGRVPRYREIMRDLSFVTGFLSEQQLEANKQELIADFMSRPEFRSKYDALTDPAAYVNELEETAGVTLPNKQQLIDDLAAGRMTRAQVLRAIAESPEVVAKYYNEAFVVTEYFGYLRRDPDASYLAWIQTLNETGDYRTMVSGFLNSLEYRGRFGPPQQP